MGERVQALIKRITHLRTTKDAESTIKAIAEHEDVEPFNAVAFQEKVTRLETEFPGYVQILSEGTALYHQSKNPQEFVADNTFKTSEATVPGTGIFLIDQPTPLTNIEIHLQRPVVCFDMRSDFNASSKALETLEDDDAKGWIGAAKKAGFNGLITSPGDSSSAFVPKDTSEIQIFDTDVAAIAGGISLYTQKGKE